MAQVPMQGEANTVQSERRAHQRFPVRSLAYVELAEGNGGVVLNISEGGMAVQSIMSLMDDDLPRVRIQLSHSRKSIEVSARIVWSADLGTVVGVKFVELSDGVRELIRDWSTEESSLPKEMPESTIASRSQLVTAPPRRNQIPVSASSASLVTNMALSDSSLVERRKSVLGALAVAAILTAVFLGLRPGFLSVSSKRKVTVDTHLGLKLDRTGRDWELTWNPNAPVVLTATKGRLYVNDGPLSKTVDLDASDLHGGSIIYSPLTTDIVWRLQVSNGSTEPVSESVRIVSPAPPFTFLKSQSASADTAKTEQNAKTKAKPAGVESRHQASDSRGSLAKSTSLLSAAPSGQDALPTARTAVAKPLVLSSASEAPLSQKVLGGELFQAAQMLLGGNPDYPTSARLDGISGTVELRFKIAADGSVRDISVVKGPTILAQAAMAAVADRKYKPARLDGVSTETEASATFDFKLN